MKLRSRAASSQLGIFFSICIALTFAVIAYIIVKDKSSPDGIRTRPSSKTRVLSQSIPKGQPSLSVDDSNRGLLSLQEVQMEMANLSRTLKGEALFSRQMQLCATFIQFSPDLSDCVIFLSQIPPGELYDYCGAALSRRFASEQPKEGIVWLEKISGQPEAANFAMHFVNSLSPESALEIVDQPVKLTQEERRQYYVQLYPILAKYDLTSALGKISKADFFDTNDKITAVNKSIGISIASGKMSQFWSEEQNVAKLVGQAYIGPVAVAWGYTDPAAAADWLRHQNLGDSGVAAGASSIASSWLKVDSKAASEWVNQLPASAVKDAAIASVIKSIAANDPEGARAWLGAVSTENMKKHFESKYNLVR